MPLRIVIIGANAAGAKAASKAKRMRPEASITVIDRGSFISYGACGIPYFVSDAVSDEKELMSTPVGVVRDANFFRKVKGVEVITETDVTEIDRQNRQVTLQTIGSGVKSTLPYDRLIIATGSSPVIPPLPGSNLPGIITVKSIEDAVLLKEMASSGNRACIIGAGLIGLETVEALATRGMDVTVVEMQEQILPGILDSEMAAILEQSITQRGVTVLKQCRVSGFGGGDRVENVVTDRGVISADLVVLAIGARPNIELAQNAGLTIGITGAISVDDHLRTSDPTIYACGDCCETVNIVTGQKIYAPLGSTANKQGRVAGINVTGGDATFSGVLGTAILRVFEANAGKTGLTETAALAAGYDVETVLSPAPDRAHFFPGAKPIALKLVAERKSGRLLGLQAVGSGAVDKRIDVAATAISFRATTDQISHIDLAYAPPFSAAMDNLIVAADILKNKLSGEAKGISPHEVKRKMEDESDDFILLDVRSPAEHEAVRIAGAKLVPLGALRDKLDSLPKDKEIIAYCKISLRGYEAQKILNAAGFTNVSFIDGGILTWPYEFEK
ncbi:MAG: FAD-dependent oxidoreductase [Desulfuromonadaceae bacterium]|nr:FAD-dependent oxidoreductase [Desulfuromonadaceae bacterium]MDD2854841.1 FAD-dependent oxidoreductase [Desulfuromonadaceae bacterium]